MPNTTILPSALRSILAATDLTHTADEVLRSAAALASRTGAALHIVHVIDGTSAPSPDPRVYAGALHREMEHAAQELEAQLQRALPERVRPESQAVVAGTPYRAILDRAKQVGADLLVLGPHRKITVSGLFLGTTADRLLRTAEVPCLIVRGELTLPLRCIATAVDLSDPARGALDLALRWAATPGISGDPVDARHPVLRVIHAMPVSSKYASSPTPRDTVEKILHSEVKAARDRTGVRVDAREEILEGGRPPAEEIVSYADTEQLDLLVLGTHG